MKGVFYPLSFCVIFNTGRHCETVEHGRSNPESIIRLYLSDWTASFVAKLAMTMEGERATSRNDGRSGNSVSEPCGEVREE